MTIKLESVLACPHCGAPVNAVSGIGVDPSHLPSPGDLSLCFYCAEFGIFEEGMTLRKLTDKESALVSSNPNAEKAKTAVLERRRERSKMH